MQRLLSILTLFFISSFSQSTHASFFSDFFPRGENLQQEPQNYANTFLQTQLNSIQIQTTPTESVTFTLTGEHAMSGPYIIHSYEFAFLAHLSPTLGGMIEDFGSLPVEDQNISIPLNYVSSHSMSILLALLRAEPGCFEETMDDMVMLVQGLTPNQINDLINDAQYLDSRFLRDIIERVFASGDMPIQEEDFSESSSDWEDLSMLSEADLAEIFPDFYEHSMDAPDFDAINAYAYRVEKKKLAKLVRYAYFALKSKFVNNGIQGNAVIGFEKNFVTDSILRDAKDKDALPLEYFPEIFKDFMITLKDGKVDLNSIDAFHPEGNLYSFILNSEIMSVAEFEGPLDEIFAYNEDIAILFQNIASALEEQRSQFETYLDLITDSNAPNEDVMKLFDFKNDMELLVYGQKLAESSRELKRTAERYRKYQPCLFTAYLLAEASRIHIHELNHPFTLKKSSRMHFTRITELKEKAKRKALLWGITTYEMIGTLLLPYMNEFLYLAGEPGREPLKYRDELQELFVLRTTKTEQSKQMMKDAENKVPRLPARIQQKTIQPAKPKAEIKNKPVVRNNKVKKKKSTPPTSSSSTTTSSSTQSSRVSNTPQYEMQSYFKEEKEVRKWEKKEKEPSYKKTEEERELKRKAHAMSVAESYKAQRKQRAERVQLRYTLSKEEAKKIISTLSTKPALFLKLLFVQPSANYILSDGDIVVLAKAIQEAMKELFGSESNAFLETVQAKIHPAHKSSDTGDKLPRHYVDILRMVFIIYGVIPEGWEPITREDFSALEYKAKK